MNRKKLYASAVTALLLLFSACEMMGPKSGTVPGPDEKAAVRIAIEASGTQGRTALPAVELEQVTAWELWGGKSFEPETLLTDFSGISTTVYLETGSWNFTLSGYKGDALILQGNIRDQTISLEGPNVLSFTVAPLMDGNGTFKITINLPEGHGITKAGVFTRDESKIDELIPVDDTLVFEGDYAAGDYYFSIRLYKGDDLYGVVSEMAQVRGNLRSEKTHTLTAEDLNLTYVVTYSLNEGELDSEAENPGYYRSTGADFILPEPTRTGYTFGGWYDDENCTGNEITVIPQGSAGDKDFYAKWTVTAYTIDYELNGGDNAAENPATYTITSAVITLAAPTRANYTFEGWHDNAEFTEDAVTSIPAGSTGDKTFYAKWMAIPYSISYELNGGINAGENPTTYTVESPVIIPEAATRDGYIFEGWYDNAEFTEDAVASIPTGSAGDKTFYARWTLDSYTITYELNGGNNNAENPASYTIESLAIALADPSRTDYTFGGWHSDVDFATAATGIPAGSTGNKIFYAQWTPINYTIAYTLNGGTNDAANPESYTVESPAITLAKPSRADYTFDGWHSDVDFATPVTEIPSGSTGNKTFYAKWTATPYTITYNLNGGTNNAMNPASYTTESPAITFAEPSWVDYTFGGWHSDAGFTTAVTGIPAGSTGDKTFYAKWNPGATVQITLQPQPNDPTLANVSIFVDEESQFSAAGTGYVSWQWRWNGTPISGANLAIYTLAANSKPAGVHELSVEVITDGGQTLSARCWVTLKAK